MKKWKITLILLFIIFSLNGILINAASHQINGTVIDSKTLIGIPDVNLYLPNLKSGVSTKNDGSFNLQINDKNDIQLFITHIAYVSKKMVINDKMQDIIITLDENFFISSYNFGNSSIDTDKLTIPHPGALLRRFVLVPLS